LNGVYTILAFNNTQGSGSVGVPVNAGDIIGYRVRSNDNIFGSGSLTIRGFDAPAGTTSVPEPTSLALMALGAAGLALVRARRNKKDA
jgi:hypothetical protein